MTEDPFPDRHPKRQVPHPRKEDAPPIHNRLRAVMAHVPWYSFQGQARLARDARVSRAAISRLIAGRTRPSYHLVWALTRAIERRIGRPLDPRELVSFDGTYPTSSVCVLLGCQGCYPPEAYDDDDNLRPAYRGQEPGDWSRSPEAPSYLDNAPAAFREGLKNKGGREERAGKEAYA